MTIYRVELWNDAGLRIDGQGSRNGREAQHWAATVMPDASKLILRTRRGQWRGWYRRPGGIGDWIDADPFGKSR